MEKIIVQHSFYTDKEGNPFEEIMPYKSWKGLPTILHDGRSYLRGGWIQKVKTPAEAIPGGEALEVIEPVEIKEVASASTVDEQIKEDETAKEAIPEVKKPGRKKKDEKSQISE